MYFMSHVTGIAHGCFVFSWKERGGRAWPDQVGSQKNPSALCNDLIVLPAVEIAARRPSLPVLIPDACTVGNQYPSCWSEPRSWLSTGLAASNQPSYA
jgi:hypothetical protein